MHTAGLVLGSSIVGLWALGSTFARAVIHKVSGF
jgi:hypothetical protein